MTENRLIERIASANTKTSSRKANMMIARRVNRMLPNTETHLHTGCTLEAKASKSIAEMEHGVCIKNDLTNFSNIAIKFLRRPEKGCFKIALKIRAMQAQNNPVTRYLKGSWEELKKVSWPSRQEAWQKSWIVVAVSLFFALFLGGVDYLLNQIIDVLV